MYLSIRMLNSKLMEDTYAYVPYIPVIFYLKFLRVTIIQCEWQAFVNALLATSAIAFLAIVEPRIESLITTSLTLQLLGR